MQVLMPLVEEAQLAAEERELAALEAEEEARQRQLQ